jgi:SAM-dependent methyltransferase
LAREARQRGLPIANGYRDDLAYIHDAGFGFLAENAAPVLIDALRRRGLRRGLVVDLGCGSGILSGAVAAAGYDVLGVDLSPAMVRLARRCVPAGSFARASLWSVQLPACAAVAAIGECLNYAFDHSGGRRRLPALLGRIHAALAPGGVLVFDAATPGRAPKPGAERKFMEGPDWAVEVTVTEERYLQSCAARDASTTGE